MVNCSVLNCKNRSVKDGHIRFFSFPKEDALAIAWLSYCRPKTNTKNGRICSVHFQNSDYHKPLRHILMNESPRKCRQLKPNAVPSLHIISSLCAKPVVDESSLDRFLEPEVLLTEGKELITDSNDVTSCSVQVQTHVETHSIETQTTGICSDTMMMIPISEYQDLMEIKNKHEKLSQMFDSGQIRYLVRSEKCPSSPKERAVRRGNSSDIEAISTESIVK